MIQYDTLNVKLYSLQLYKSVIKTWNCSNFEPFIKFEWKF